MKRMLSLSGIPVLLSLLLWAAVVHAAPCQNNIPPSNPDAVYIDHGDGTVTDSRTGLMWKQCAEGAEVLEAVGGCHGGSPHSFTWAGALAQAEASVFAGYTDWRLPNVKELSSLVEGCRASPAINAHRFPNTWSYLFWSASPFFPGASNYVWVVHFGSGSVTGNDRSGSGGVGVRLVRGGQ